MLECSKQFPFSVLPRCCPRIIFLYNQGLELMDMPSISHSCYRNVKLRTLAWEAGDKGSLSAQSLTHTYLCAVQLLSLGLTPLSIK